MNKQFVWISSDGNIVQAENTSDISSLVRKYLSDIITDYEKLPQWAKDTLYNKITEDENHLEYVRFIMKAN